MPKHAIIRSMFVFAAALVAAGFLAPWAASASAVVPAPSTDVAPAKVRGLQTAVFAGGCFWGVEAVYRSVKGVTSAVSGYAGGDAKTASYDVVSSGSTRHAESVKVTFDPAQVSYGTLLQIFFSVVHDPTQLNRQGPDVGPQYRSAIFTLDDEQRRVAKSYIEQLGRAKVFPRPIVTEVTPLPAFHDAEPYHQNYVALHPLQPYIVMHDLPKLAAFRQHFPKLVAAK